MPADSAPRPAITVVVAAPLGGGDLPRFLAAIEPQLDGDVDVTVAHDGRGQLGPLPTWARAICVPGGTVPALWAAGLDAVTAPLAALTATSLCPRNDWLAGVRRAAQRGHAAVGGAMEPDVRPGAAGWTVLFCRYARYLTPLPDGTAPDPPADNAVYAMEPLRRHRSLWSGGFWEPFVHAALRADGEQLSMSDEFVVRQGAAVSLARFTAQRYVHGRSHGRLRSAGESSAAILAGVATAPAVPLLMTVRVGRETWRRRRLRWRFLVATPLIVWCFSAWAAGEAVGRVSTLQMRYRTPVRAATP